MKDNSGKIRIAYTGTAMEDGLIDADELFPALAAFAKLIQRANKVIGNNEDIKVMIKPDDIRTGSFDVTFTIVPDILQQLKLVMNWAEDTGVKALLDILAYSTAGMTVFQAVKTLGGKKISAVAGENNLINISVDGQIQATMTQNTYNVFLDYECRQHIEKVVKPLYQEGIDGFEIRRADAPEDNTPVVPVEKEDIDKFVAPAQAIEKVEDFITEGRMIYTIVSIVFDEEQKWRFTDGEVKFWAKIGDAAFWQKVDSGEISFRKGDKLEVEYISRQYQNEKGGFSVDRTITKVLRKLEQPTQIQLF